VYLIIEVGYCGPFQASLPIVEVVEMTGQKKDILGITLLGIVHLVCCGLLLVFALGGISIGMAMSYIQESIVPLGIAIATISIAWAGYRLWRGSTLRRN
jgi:hypothetical protein